jgi:hypothetical protein
MLTEEQIQSALWDQTNDSVRGKECISCGLIQVSSKFRKDSSFKDGIRDQCYTCETSPRLSTSEHVHRLREANYGAARSQRWGLAQLDFINDEARMGRWRHHADLVLFLRKIPNLFLMDGNFINDVSVFRTYGQPQPHLNNNSFEYIMYFPLGWSPEHSLMEFDNRDVPVRERQRGYRTVVLRLLKAGLTTEEKITEHFGEALGEGAANWRRQLFVHRNGHD